MQLTPNATSPIGSHSPLRGWQCVALHNGEQLETPPTKLRCRPVRWTDHSTLQAVNTLHGVKSPNSSKSHPSHACNLHAVHSAVNWSGRALEFESVMNGALWLVEPRGDLQIVFINGPQVPRQADPATGFWGVTGQLTERSLSLGFRLAITGDCGGWRSDIFWGNMLRPLIASWPEIPPSPTPESASAPAAIWLVEPRGSTNQAFHPPGAALAVR